MRPTVTKIAIPAAVAALTLTACGNPFGASTESKSTKSSGSSSSSSAQVSHSSSSSAASAATSSSASPSSSPSVVTVTATPEPTPSTVTVYASPDKSSSSPSSSSSSSGKAKAGAPASGQEALERNKSKLRGSYTWAASSSDTSNYDANVELSWIVVVPRAAPTARTILCCSTTASTWGPALTTPCMGSLMFRVPPLTRFRPRTAPIRLRSPGTVLRGRSS